MARKKLGVQYSHYLSKLNARKRNKTSMKLANNTELTVWEVSGKYASGCVEYLLIQLHNTDIITMHPDGKIRLFAGSYQTPTTLKRLNEFTPFNLYQRNFTWYIEIGGVEVEFIDGLIIQDVVQ